MQLPESQQRGRQQQLEKLMSEVGCSLQGLKDHVRQTFDEGEAERRIRTAIKSWQESWLWLVALISAIIALISAAASVVSAMAAWSKQC